MYKRILIPTDGSALSEQAAREAIDIARACGAAVVAFSVAQPYPQLPAIEGAMTIDPVTESAEQQALALSYAQSVADLAAAAGVPGESHIALSFAPHEEIVRAADEYHCDVIFMASHGRRGVNRLLAGSETQKVLAYARVPVLVFHPSRRE